MAQRKKARAADPMVLLRQLDESLEGGALAPAYVLRGEERYFREKALQRIRARASAEGLEACVHDAERGNPDFSLARAIDDLSGTGLFGERRFVVLRNAGEALKKGAGGPSALTQAIERFLADGGGGTLVLSLPSLRADHAVSKAVTAAGGPILDLRKLWDSPTPWNPDPRRTELVRWALARAKDLGLALTPDQAVYVCAASGNDLFGLDDALERLKHAEGGDLAAAVGWDATTAPWNVAEHLLAGDLARALAGVEVLFRSGFQEKSGRRLLDAAGLAAMLVGSLSRGVRRSLLVASELAAGTAEADAARLAGVSGRAVAPALERARTHRPAEWARRLEEVSELERRAKSSVGVDANDFVLLARRWASAAPQGAGARGNLRPARSSR